MQVFICIVFIYSFFSIEFKFCILQYFKKKIFSIFFQFYCFLFIIVIIFNVKHLLIYNIMPLFIVQFEFSYIISLILLLNYHFIY